MAVYEKSGKKVKNKKSSVQINTTIYHLGDTLNVYIHKYVPFLAT